MRMFIVICLASVVFLFSFLMQSWLTTLSPTGNSSVPPAPSCHRMVSMSPGITETLFALGLGEQLVGVTRFCTYPPETSSIANIGGLLDTNYEAILALSPDWVLMSPYHKDHQLEFKRMGIACLVVHQDSLAEIQDSFLLIGSLCAREMQAQQLVEVQRAHLQTLQEQTAAAPRQRVLLLTGRDIRSGKLDELYAVGPGSFLDEIIAIAGGINCAPGKRLEYPALSAEGLLQLDPDVIIELAGDVENADDVRETALAAWRVLPGLRALEMHRIHLLTGAYLTIPGPRVPKIADALARCLHPELFQERSRG